MSSPSAARTLPHTPTFWRIVYVYLALLTFSLIVFAILKFKFEKVQPGRVDFKVFYMASRLVREYPATQLYDLELQKKMQQDLRFQGSFVPYIHPPFEVLLFYPFGAFSYWSALLLWFAFNCILILGLPLVFSRTLPLFKGRGAWLVLAGALTFLPIDVCLFMGQDSIVLLWLIIGTYFMLKNEKFFWAGVLLGLAFFKFHIAYLIAVPLMLRGKFRGVMGLLSSLVILLLISILWIGYPGMRSYLFLLGNGSSSDNEIGFNLADMHNWAAQLHLWGYKGIQSLFGAILMGIIGTLGLIVVWWGDTVPAKHLFGLRLAATLLIALLVSPYLIIHDVTVAFLALILCAEYLGESPVYDWKRNSLILILFITPLVWNLTSSLSAQLHLALGTLWMTALLFILCVTIQSFPREAH